MRREVAYFAVDGTPRTDLVRCPRTSPDTRPRPGGCRPPTRRACRRGEATNLFGKERGGQLAGLLGAIEQTFGKKSLYPTAQGRAAHILYFVIKDHPFSDGNKRIGTLLFLESLRRSGLLLRADGRPRFLTLPPGELLTAVPSAQEVLAECRRISEHVELRKLSQSARAP